MPPTVSVAIITLNESSNIRLCLQSVKWANEVVVVDSGSTDGTLAVCAELGCRIFSRGWEGYASQKNHAMSQTTGEWILSLDADEAVTPQLADEIRNVVSSSNAVEAYEIPRQNYFLGKAMRHGGWYPDRQLRLLHRGAGEFAIVPLHEHIKLSEGTRLGRLRNPLLHYTYPTVKDFFLKADRYTDVEAACAKEGVARGSLILSMATAFPLKFAEVYLYKGGWKDGLHGFIAATLVAMRVFVRYVKIWEISKTEKSLDEKART